MGYYMGDFYRGYRGDPGFFSFLGGLAKKAVGFIPGVGPAVSAGLGAITTRAPKIAQATSQIVKRGTAVIAAHPVLSAAGAAGAAGTLGAVAMHARSSRAAAGMSAGRALMVGHRRHRRMNVCNPKALRRAVRRTHSFAKLAMKTIHLVHPKKKVTFGGFKKRRKK